MISRKTQPEKTLSELLKSIPAFRMGLDHMTSRVSFQPKLVCDSQKKKGTPQNPQVMASILHNLCSWAKAHIACWKTVEL